MRGMDRLGMAIDRALGIFLPGVEAKRLAARAVSSIRREHAERMYAAAKVTQSTGGWLPVNYTPNEVIGQSLPRLQARVRQLVRDMPHFSRAVTLGTSYTVGEGMQVKPRVLDGAKKLDKALNQAIEDAWRRWCDEADISGMQCFQEMEVLAKRQDLEVGEFLFRERIDGDRNRFLPLAFELIEPDALTSAGTWGLFKSAPALATSLGVVGKNEVILGVEIDPETYKRVGFHFQETATPFKSFRLPAAEITHGFETLRPKQVRGVSPFAPGILIAHSLRDYIDAEIDGAKMAARYLAFITTQDPQGLQLGNGAKTDSSYGKAKVEEIGYAVNQYLLPGEQVQLTSHNRPGNTFDPFTQFVIRTFAIVSGFPYELVSGDYRDLTYTTIRGSRNDLEMTLKPQQRRHVRQLTQKVYYRFLDWAVLSGRLDLPGYFANPWPWRRAYFIPPGMAPVDPLKEGRAAIDGLKSGLMSPQQHLLDQGMDPDDVLDDLDAWWTEINSREIPVDQTSKATQTNPAALTAKDNEEEGDGQDKDEDTEGEK